MAPGQDIVLPPEVMAALSANAEDDAVCGL